MEDEPAEREQAHGLEREGGERREEHGGQIGRGWERSGAQALEQAALATNDKHDREPGEGGVRRAVAEQPGEKDVHRRAALDRVVVDRAQQGVQEEREDEDEDGRLPASPEDPLLEAQLVGERAHSSFSSTRSR